MTYLIDEAQLISQIVCSCSLCMCLVASKTPGQMISQHFSPLFEINDKVGEQFIFTSAFMPISFFSNVYDDITQRMKALILQNWLAHSVLRRRLFSSLRNYCIMNTNYVTHFKSILFTEPLKLFVNDILNCFNIY